MRFVHNAKDRSDDVSDPSPAESQELLSYGYSRQDAGLALAAADGESEKALIILYTKLTGNLSISSSFKSVCSEATPSADLGPERQVDLDELFHQNSYLPGQIFYVKIFK